MEWSLEAAQNREGMTYDAYDDADVRDGVGERFPKSSQRHPVARNSYMFYGQNTQACSPTPNGVPPASSYPMTTPNVKDQERKGQKAFNSSSFVGKPPKGAKGVQRDALWFLISRSPGGFTNGW